MTTFREKGAKWKYLIFLQTKLSENFIFYQRRMNSGKIDRGFFSTMTIQSNSTPKSSLISRIVPSLTTLKLIQDCPVDYHSQTGTLVVGDPVVGEVCYNGKVYTPDRLPFAREEAEMIGRLLGAHILY